MKASSRSRPWSLGCHQKTVGIARVDAVNKAVSSTSEQRSRSKRNAQLLHQQAYGDAPEDARERLLAACGGSPRAGVSQAWHGAVPSGESRKAALTSSQRIASETAHFTTEMRLTVPPILSGLRKAVPKAK